MQEDRAPPGGAGQKWTSRGDVSKGSTVKMKPGQGTVQLRKLVVWTT